MPRLAIVDDLAAGNSVEATFVPLNLEIGERIDREWNMRKRAEPDAGWMWPDFALWCADNPIAFVGVAMETMGKIQGAVVFSLTAFSSLQPGEGSLHIERLATAPWNRPSVTSQPILRGIGQSLIQYVVLYSYRLGLKGRVLLSSLPSAEGFYRRLRFRSVGLADSENLPLYEIMPADAIELLKQRRLRHG